jgi:O-antigen ligase
MIAIESSSFERGFFVLMPIHVSLRTRLPQIGICICFMLMASWLRFTAAPPLFSAVYISRFVLLSAMLLTCAIWFACGMPGFRTLCQNRVRALALLCLLLLALWAYASQSWGYAAASRPESGLNAALSWCVVALFTVVVASTAPPTTWIVAALLVTAGLNAVLAVAQVAAGSALGWDVLGEFRFGAGVDGTSLIRAGDLTFVRPYGLFAHPNMLGGLLVVGVLLAVGMWTTTAKARGTRRILQHEGTVKAERHGENFPFVFNYLPLILFALLLYALLLTFSRAAWIGLAAGGAAWLGLVWRRDDVRAQHDRARRGENIPVGAQYIAPTQEQDIAPLQTPLYRRLLAPILVALVVGGVFVAQYRPLLGARVGEGTESLELRSISDRLVYTDFALRAIAEHPLVGQGAGYFPWRASAYLQETFFDLRGDHVHQVYLSVWAEMGVVGFVLLCAALCLGVEAGLRAVHAASPDEQMLRAALLASVLALAIIGLFDHYPYSQLPFMALWWGLLATRA